VSARELAVAVTLTLGVGVELLCCLGVATARGTLARIHYAAAGSTLGPFLLAAAVALEESLSATTLTAVLVAATLFVLGAAAAHAIARAARPREDD
jgi:multisubunit Na+/H+ antiporter MnhG subunit